MENNGSAGCLEMVAFEIDILQYYWNEHAEAFNFFLRKNPPYKSHMNFSHSVNVNC
jgi:hypothetical protein